MQFEGKEVGIRADGDIVTVSGPGADALHKKLKEVAVKDAELTDPYYGQFTFKGKGILDAATAANNIEVLTIIGEMMGDAYEQYLVDLEGDLKQREKPVVAIRKGITH